MTYTLLTCTSVAVYDSNIPHSTTSVDRNNGLRKGEKWHHCWVLCGVSLSTTWQQRGGVSPLDLMESPGTLFLDSGLLDSSGNYDAPTNLVPKTMILYFCHSHLISHGQNIYPQLDILLAKDGCFLSCLFAGNSLQVQCIIYQHLSGHQPSQLLLPWMQKRVFPAIWKRSILLTWMSPSRSLDKQIGLENGKEL